MDLIDVKKNMSSRKLDGNNCLPVAKSCIGYELYVDKKGKFIFSF